jgi:alpha-ketoglutarate-dependent 2,4-dichlorophenoxyacetate dioxygenase
VGLTNFSEAVRAALPPVPQVLVRQHAATRRNALYLGPDASHVIGWPIDEGRGLLAELMDFATQPAFVHEHVWRKGDLIVWDNRCIMRRALPYEDMTQRRVLHRTTAPDEINSVERAAQRAG